MDKISLHLEIIDLNSEGAGVAKQDGKVIFVSGALPGEKVTAEIISEKKAFSTAKMTAIIQASPERTNPVCSHFGKCGGCQLQHLTYEAQLTYKQNVISQSLQRLGGFDPNALPIKPILPSDKQLEYRNKAQVPFGHHHKTPVLGYYRFGSHEVVNLHECHLHHPDFTKIVVAIRDLVIENKIPVYLTQKQAGLLRHLVIRQSSETKELQLCFVINGNTFPYTQLVTATIETLNKALSEYTITSAVININKSKSVHIFGDKNKRVWGNDYIAEKIGDHFFRLAPNTFLQVNLGPAKKIYAHLKSQLPETSNTIVDLYCGIGTISLFVSDKATRVIGIEANKQSVKDAKTNATNNLVENCEFIHGKVEDIKNDYAPEVVIADPPRKGLEEKGIRSIGKLNPKQLFYLSCNPATLARDLKILTDKQGYIIKEITPFDLFPQTTHVECFVALEKP